MKGVGEPGCVSPRANLTRRCGAAEDVSEVLKILCALCVLCGLTSLADFVRDPERFSAAAEGVSGTDKRQGTAASRTQRSGLDKKSGSFLPL